MFSITLGKGFQIKFKNGWTVSVQFGVGNYCDNKNLEALCTLPFSHACTGRSDFYSCKNAEIAAWNKKKVWYKFEDDTVKGWVSPEEVASFIEKISKLKG